MIRFVGTKEDGTTVVIGLVLQPENLARLKRGEPIYIDLRGMVESCRPEGLITAPCELLLGYEGTEGFVAQEMLKQAKADGARINVIPKAPGDPQ